MPVAQRTRKREGGKKSFVVNYEYANMVRNKAVRMAEIITL